MQYGDPGIVAGLVDELVSSFSVFQQVGAIVQFNEQDCRSVLFVDECEVNMFLRYSAKISSVVAVSLWRDDVCESDFGCDVVLVADC